MNFRQGPRDGLYLFNDTVTFDDFVFLRPRQQPGQRLGTTDIILYMKNRSVKRLENVPREWITFLHTLCGKSEPKVMLDFTSVPEFISQDFFQDQGELIEPPGT